MFHPLGRLQNHFRLLTDAEASSVFRPRVFNWTRPEVERDVFPPRVNSGTIVVALAWLLFYVIAAVHQLWS